MYKGCLSSAFFSSFHILCVEDHLPASTANTCRLVTCLHLSSNDELSQPSRFPRVLRKVCLTHALSFSFHRESCYHLSFSKVSEYEDTNLRVGVKQVKQNFNLSVAISPLKAKRKKESRIKGQTAYNTHKLNKAGIGRQDLGAEMFCFIKLGDGDKGITPINERSTHCMTLGRK